MSRYTGYQDYHRRATVKWQRKLREKARSLFPRACAICGIVGVLDLHHLTYRKERPLKDPMKTFREAIENPKNFVQLCRRCHFAVSAVYKISPEVIPKLLEIVKLTRKGLDK